MQKTLAPQLPTTPLPTSTSAPTSPPTTPLDVLIIGAGFGGCYLLHQLRSSNFSALVLEAGSDLGGIWHWNRYPGARVDSQWPAYALSLPELRDWKWGEQYPSGEKLRAYFAFVESKLGLKKDVRFGVRVKGMRWVEEAGWKGWEVEWEGLAERGDGEEWRGRGTLRARTVVAAVGFAAKRYFPPWPGLDSFRGTVHHSSFWPAEGVAMRGQRVAVVGTGATGVQVVQECGREVGEEGSLTVFQRTPNLACPMQQRVITREEDERVRKEWEDVYRERLTHDAGFMYSTRKGLKTFDHSAEERERLFEELWELGGFRFIGNSYADLLIDEKANLEAYNFWARKVRARIKNPVKRDILAPLKPPHSFGSKRLSLETDYYEQFNKPNVHIVDINATPVTEVVPEGIRTADGKLHEFDIIALATGFDSITGGLKDIEIRGKDGQLLIEKWSKGTWTYLGMTTASFPNFFFLYGPQAPTAFSNGPSCVEAQVDWLAEVLKGMREKGKEMIDATKESEEEWRKLVFEFSERTLRHSVDSWYNGYNIPGKPREPLNYSGGLPDYIRRLKEVRENGMKGFEVI